MSIDSMVRKADTKADIKYESSTTGAGGQLTKTWVARHENVQGRLASIKHMKEILYFDRQKVFADFAWFMAYKSGITTRDRLFVGSRQFLIKLIVNWDEQNKYLIIALTEETDD